MPRLPAYLRALPATFACIASMLASAAPTATFIDSPVRAFTPAITTLRIDGFPGLLGRGTPTSELLGSTLLVVLNSDCGFLCPGIMPQTFSVPIPDMPPGDYEVVVRSERTGGYTASGSLKVEAGPNFQGLWWASPAGIESGWGMQIAHQAETLFVTWYTYEADGRPVWFVMPNALRVNPNTYRGTVYRTIGSAGGQAFNLDALSGWAHEGTASLEFTGPDNAVFQYQVGDRSGGKAIVRQVFAQPVPQCTARAAPTGSVNYQDLWWNAPAGSESGWGVQIAHQGDILFATFFGYDAQSRPTWLVMPDGRQVAPGRYAGDVFSTRGPSFDETPWDPARVSSRREGRAEITFSSYGNGQLTIQPAPGGTISASKAITRQSFAYPTVCAPAGA